MKTFLMGLGVGAALGIMFAPEAGEQTRKKLKQNANPVGRRLGELYQKVFDKVEAEPDSVAQVLNTASKTKLKRVPGIGDATAKRIIQNRPYESGEEVVEGPMLPEEILEKPKQELVENRKGRSNETMQEQEQASRPAEEPAFSLAPESGIDSGAAQLLNILNTASKTKLMSVPGIGDATARRIIDARPYNSADRVVDDGIISEELVSNLKKRLLEKEESVA